MRNIRPLCNALHLMEDPLQKTCCNLIVLIKLISLYSTNMYIYS